MRNDQRGLSVVEVMLAAALFVVFATAAGGVVIQGVTGNRLGVELSVANQFASEGLEAVRSIKNQNFSSLSSPQGGVAQTSGVWTFSGANNTLNAGKTYTRTLAVSNVQRDCSGDIVVSGGVNDANTKKVTSTVNWSFTSSRPQTITLTSYLTDWKKAMGSSGAGGGILVYGNGGTTSDAIAYKTLSSAGVWSSVSGFDIDNTSTNKALRGIRLFASKTRNEKIAITKHLAGTSNQSIYINVFDGSSWTSTQLSSWSSTSSVDVRNYDGTYLNNGDFMVIYSDNTTTPKYQIWNGYCWSAGSLQNLSSNNSGVPLYIVADNRPGTNEVMVAMYGTSSDTNTQYYDGSNWFLHQRHSAAGPPGREMVDFVWSPQVTTKGVLIYPRAASGNNSRSFLIKTYDATTGNWSSDVSSPSTGNTVGSMDINARIGAEEYLGCTKNSASDIYCYRSNSTPVITTPTNNVLTPNTDPGLQRSYDVGFERATGAVAVAVYSDNTAIPKLKKFTSATNTFDSAATSLASVATVLQTVRLRQLSGTDDMMILMSNAGNDVYTVGWNGSSNVVYSSGGKAQTVHGINGSGNEDFWYDFAWDEY